METLIVKVKDARKLDFVLELLRDLDYLEVSQETDSLAVAEPEPFSDVEIASMSPEERARLFLKTAGIWEGRDIDADELRRQVWQRDHTLRS